MQKMIKTKQLFLDKRSQLCLIYGLYAVLCHLALITLHIPFHQEDISHSVLAHMFLPWLEHSLMSLTLVIGGSVALALLD